MCRKCNLKIKLNQQLKFNRNCKEYLLIKLFLQDNNIQLNSLQQQLLRQNHRIYLQQLLNYYLFLRDRFYHQHMKQNLCQLLQHSQVQNQLVSANQNKRQYKTLMDTLFHLRSMLLLHNNLGQHKLNFKSFHCQYLLLEIHKVDQVQNTYRLSWLNSYNHQCITLCLFHNLNKLLELNTKYNH